MSDFIEPRPLPILIRLLQLSWRIYSAVKLGNLHIKVSKNLLDVFVKLRGKHTIICANHPATADAAIIFGLSSIVSEQFAFLTAREMFGRANSFQARWLQKIGCYSVERATADVEAFKATCFLLQQGQYKVVIFPEGEISYQNNFVREFENGPELIALSALHELRKSGSSDSIEILPLALKYRYARDIRLDLLAIMQQIETKLGLKLESQPLNTRLRSAFETIFATLEEAQCIGKQPQAKLDARFNLLCQSTISEIEKFAQRQYSNDLSQLHRIHLLMNELSKMQYKHEHKKLSWSKKSARHKLVNLYFNKLKRLIRLRAVGEHSFAHDLTQEEAAELLSLLVQEVNEKIRLKKPEIVELEAAEVIDVSQFLPTNHSNERKKCVQKLKLELERRISASLLALEQAHIPIMIHAGIQPAAHSGAHTTTHSGAHTTTPAGILSELQQDA